LQYEISNFAKDGFASRHNSVYWERENYIGFGLSTHSLYNNIRFENTGDLGEYISGKTPRRNIIKLTSKDIMEEFIFLGLRMTKGVSFEKFKKEFDVDIYDVYGDIISKNTANKLLEVNNGRIKLTKKGIDLSNAVLSEFIR